MMQKAGIAGLALVIGLLVWTELRLPTRLDTEPYTDIFGGRVMVFEPGMDMTSVQRNLNFLHLQQAKDEFSKQRYALLFKPGDYDLDITVDYYVEAAGLGRLPGEVRIRGFVQSTSSNWGNNNVTTMFWRSASNFHVSPTSDILPMFWAVSQAAPFRRMHVLGDVQFDLSGWASGGFLADSIIEGRASLTTGQQWFTRNSNLGSWSGGNWNRTFVGTTGTPDEKWPEVPNTVVETTPVIREKPFLFIDQADEYFVFVPALTRSTQGVSWKDGPEDGETVPIEDFHIAFPESDTAATMNAALESGRHILFTPGIYNLEDTIHVNRPDTVILGIGLATLVPQTGKPALTTADVPGIKIAGIMVDAGVTASPVLIEIGPPGSGADHSPNPISLHDVFIRVGGAIAGKAEVCLVVNSHDVVIDHAWLWRADHGAGAEWDINTSRNGLIVNGDDVTIYGLFNEHFQEYQTLWNGERGRTYFYQSEIPYDPPSQELWMAGDTLGYASYKVADHVQEHEAWGLGIYSFFGVREDEDPGVRLQSAIECPDNPGIRFTHVSTFAGWHGGMNFPLNELGEPTNVQELKFFDGLRPDPVD